ncbi:hypothetical protein niasHT_032396 [Heterodera trifolii]|uniref:Nuclear receptor domain-containing protein n=1 Tax=Heterodera trifolii TaxID=157864 RepID=A0ABD2HVG2_9BILA
MEKRTSHNHITAEALTRAVQMEMDFIQRILLGPQRANLTAIEYLKAQNLGKSLSSTKPNDGTEWKNGEKVPKFNIEKHAKGNDGAEKAKSTEDKSETNGKHKIGMGRLKREVGECKVCARPSLYCYYGVKCCESCKQFFRRIVSKRTLFNCFEGKHCQIGEDGIRCRGCRLDKCLLAGMEPTMIKAKPKDGEALAQYLARLELRKRSALARNN